MAPLGRRRATSSLSGRAGLRGGRGWASLAAAGLAVLVRQVATVQPKDEAVVVTDVAAAGGGTDATTAEPNATANTTAEASDVLLDAEANGTTNSFDYHKNVFPMDWKHDGLTVTLAVIGLMIAASGGIGGGGILVPVYMLALGFKPKHAIALSNFTILGGSIANTVVNSRKRHPVLDRTLIDWDLILIMEPLTIFGAVFGSLMGKILPNIILTVSLVLVLSFMGYRTLTKGINMWKAETVKMTVRPAGDAPELELRETSAREMHSVQATSPISDNLQDVEYCEMDSDTEALGKADRQKPPKERSIRFKIGWLTACFAGICFLTVLKGGGNFRSPLGFPCGSAGFWLLYFGNVPWVLAFAMAFRWLLVGEFQAKVRSGHTFIKGEVKWDSHNTIKYPAICAISGLLAGLFGVGGGIVKGPLMLEMGILPSVASASAAAMILFTAAAASTSFVVFGLLHFGYGCLFFMIGFISTCIGQYGVGRLVEKHNRQSPIVLSIGAVICLSSVMVFVQDIVALSSGQGAELIRFHGICTSEA